MIGIKLDINIIKNNRFNPYCYFYRLTILPYNNISNLSLLFKKEKIILDI